MASVCTIQYTTHRYKQHRALLIPFQEPSLKPTTKERSSYQNLLDLLEVLSSRAGAVISMGKRFVEDHKEVILLATLSPKYRK